MKRNSSRWAAIFAVLLCFFYVLPVQGEETETPNGYYYYREYLREAVAAHGADVYEDGTSLVVCVTDSAHITAMQEKLPEAAVKSGAIKFKVVEYPPVLLQGLGSYLDKSHIRDAYTIKRVRVDMPGNCVEIFLQDTDFSTELRELLHQREYEEGMFHFVQYVPPPQPTVGPVTTESITAVDFSASPRTYVILIGTVIVLVAEYSIFGWLERRAVTGR